MVASRPIYLSKCNELLDHKSKRRKKNNGMSVFTKRMCRLFFVLLDWTPFLALSSRRSFSRNNKQHSQMKIMLRNIRRARFRDLSVIASIKILECPHDSAISSSKPINRDADAWTIIDRFFWKKSNEGNFYLKCRCLWKYSSSKIQKLTNDRQHINSWMRAWFRYIVIPTDQSWHRCANDDR